MHKEILKSPQRQLGRLIGEVLENNPSKIPKREIVRNELKTRFSTLVSDSPGTTIKTSPPIDFSVVMKFNRAVFKVMESNEFKHHDQITQARDRKHLIQLSSQLSRQLHEENIQGRRDNMLFMKQQEKQLNKIKEDLQCISDKIDGVDEDVLKSFGTARELDKAGQKYKSMTERNVGGKNRNMRVITDSACFRPEFVQVGESRTLWYKGTKGTVGDMVRRGKVQLKKREELQKVLC
jgi:hypothetical protein